MGLRRVIASLTDGVREGCMLRGLRDGMVAWLCDGMALRRVLRGLGHSVSLRLSNSVSVGLRDDVGRRLRENVGLWLRHRVGRRRDNIAGR